MDAANRSNERLDLGAPAPRRTNMAGRAALLVAALLAVALAGCSVVEPQDADVAPASRCAMLGPQAAAAYNQPRVVHYRTDVDMGDGLPRSVTTRGGGAVRTWVGRQNRTTRVPSDTSPLVAWLVAQVTLLIVGGFVLLVLLGMLTGQRRTAQRPSGRRIAALALVGGGLVAGGTLAGYLAGSVVSIDNATGVPVTVEIGGETVQLPAWSFTDLRVWGSSVEIDTSANGQLVEHLTAHLDDGPVAALRRAMLTNGRFVYCVCGTNSYSLQRAHYGR